MSKVYLSPSCQYDNAYAYGNTTEAVQCIKIANACKTALERCGISVKMPSDNSLVNRCAESDKWGADLHVPIHTNAFDGKLGGTRVFFYKPDSSGYDAAKAIYSTLCPLTPGKSDNLTQNKILYELKYPKAPAVYVEAEFHDVAAYAKWIIDHTTLIGEAICSGICAYFGATYKYQADSADNKPACNVLYRVQTGAFSKKGNAENYCADIKKAGFDAFIVIADGLYKVQVGAFANKDNAQAMLAKVKKAGFTAFITAVPSAPAKKSIEEIAKEVISGKWGNGTERKNRLSAAGYDYAAVQKKVNELL